MAAPPATARGDKGASSPGKWYTSRPVFNSKGNSSLVGLGWRRHLAGFRNAFPCGSKCSYSERVCLFPVRKLARRLPPLLRRIVGTVPRRALLLATQACLPFGPRWPQVDRMVDVAADIDDAFILDGNIHAVTIRTEQAGRMYPPVRLALAVEPTIDPRLHIAPLTPMLKGWHKNI